MKCEKLLEDIKRLSDEDIYNKFIIGGEIWYFKMRFDNQWYRYYDEFKLFISKKLEVHYNDIAVAGSAKLGFSINPNKKLKAFDNSSDIDIVIISRKYFYMFWDAYIQDSYSEIKINNFNKIHFSIFRKYIDLEGFSKKNETYTNWLKKTQGFEKDLQLEFDIEHNVHYRIFESWDSAKVYYMSSIKKLRRSIEENIDEDK